MRRSALCRRRSRLMQHELDVFLAIRQFHVHPVQHLPVARSPPDFLEAKNIAVEGHRRFERVDNDTCIIHSEARFAETALPRSRRLHPASRYWTISRYVHSGSLRLKIGVPDTPPGHILRYFDAFGREIFPHRFHVVSLYGIVDEASAVPGLLSPLPASSTLRSRQLSHRAARPLLPGHTQ